MAILRLAGQGIKALRGLGRAGKPIKALGGRSWASLGREAAADAVIGSAVVGGLSNAGNLYGLATGDTIDSRLTELAGQDPLDGKYKIGLGDRALSTLSGLFGGETLDQAGIEGRAEKIENRAVQKEYEDLITGFGGTFTEGMSKGDAARELQRAKLASQEAEYVNSQRYKDAVEEKNYRRKKDKEATEYTKAITAIAREDKLLAQSLARQDNLQSRRENLDLALANLAFKEAESKREFNYKASADKKARLQAALAGLTSLGSAFAIDI